jgi:hypothetical protein
MTRYRELAEAGFTHSFSTFPDSQSMAQALDIARAAGVKLFIAVPELGTDPAAVARRFQGHPALAGYHIRDEPSAADFRALAEQVRKIQAVDPVHGCYINLFPNYATPEQLGTPTYREHVERFMREVPVPYLSFDHYPVTKPGLRAEWYENLEVIADAARQAKKPFWAFALSVAHGPYPVATPAHLRLQVYSNLAYGAQCIQYFTYWTVRDPVWDFHDAPIDLEGRRTPVYDHVKQVNAEIRALSPVFLGAQVLRVGHTGPLSTGTRAYQPEPPIREVMAADGAAVSPLENGGRRYLAIVNRSYEQPIPVGVTLDGTTAVSEFRKDGRTYPVPNRAFFARVPPGDIVILEWQK